MNKELMEVVEKYLGDVKEKFYDEVKNVYGDDEDFDEEMKELGGIDGISEVDMMDELLSYLVGNMSEVFDECDKDGMVGEMLFN